MTSSYEHISLKRKNFLANWANVSFGRILLHRVCFISRGMRRKESESRMGEMKKTYKILVGKCEGENPFVIPRRRWKII